MPKLVHPGGGVGANLAGQWASIANMMTGLLLVTALATAADGEVRNFDAAGVKRTALVFSPSSPRNAPIVFAFHGHGGSARNASRNFAIHRHWPEAIVVYPQGLPTKSGIDPEGKRAGWQNSVGVEGDRDLALFDAMLDTFVKSGQADPKRVYAMGHSNGGRFTYLLWAERGDRLAAVGPSAASGWSLAEKFRPKSAFVIAGQSDPIVSFESQRRTMEAIRGVLQCGAPARVRKEGYATYEPGLNGTELCTYIHPGDHAYPQAASPLMVAFFRRH